MKIPFDIKYRTHIESGKYKVETRDGHAARIICWDSPIEKDRPIIGVVYDDQIEQYKADGHYENGYETSDYDLFIVTPEPQMSEMEISLLSWLSDDTSGEIPMERMKHIVKARATELLALAREQFIKDGYVIEKKAFHDAVEKIDDKQKAEMSIEYSLHCKIENGTRHAVMNWKEFQKLAQKFTDIGKAEALKDLPRWRKWGNGACGNSDGRPIALVAGYGGIRFVSCLGTTGEKYIFLSDLKKLPGFNED